MRFQHAISQLDAGPILAGLRDGLKALRSATGRRPPSIAHDHLGATLTELAELLLSQKGEASGTVLAATLLEAFHAADDNEKLNFLLILAERFGAERAATDAAISAYRSEGTVAALDALHALSEPRRQELIRRLNLAPGGTAALVAMRETVVDGMKSHPELQNVDADFRHLLSSWFNRGFLEVRRIDWQTPAHILEKVMHYEAVHEIYDWNDLKNRLQPEDRRCYAFFHPQLVDEPLIFVEIALTNQVPGAILPLLDLNRAPIRADAASTAVFYSISNTQRGLAGISFGNFLIKQVVNDLSRELPNLKHFVTLSPIPGFASWLRQSMTEGTEFVESIEDSENLDHLFAGQPSFRPEEVEHLRAPLMKSAARYLLSAKSRSGLPLDPVARFHIGNGASVERLNFLGDTSAKGLRQSFGMMVNYRYDRAAIESNHEAYFGQGRIATSEAISLLARSFETV